MGNVPIPESVLATRLSRLAQANTNHSNCFVQGTQPGLEEGRILTFNTVVISVAWIHQADLLLPVFSMLLAPLPRLIAMVTRETHDFVKICNSVSARFRNRDTRSIFKANILEFMVKFNLLMCTSEILRALFQSITIKRVSHKVSHNLFSSFSL